MYLSYLLFFLWIIFFVDLDYFCCLKIVEILKETEKESKNMFGMYSSQRMKVLNKNWIVLVFILLYLGLENNCFKLWKEFDLSWLVCFFEKQKSVYLFINF